MSAKKSHIAYLLPAYWFCIVTSTQMNAIISRPILEIECHNVCEATEGTVSLHSWLKRMTSNSVHLVQHASSCQPIIQSSLLSTSWSGRPSVFRFSDDRADLFFCRMLPAKENSLSHGTVEPGVANYLFAIWASLS